MVDWTRLPKDMLELISKYLESSLDLVQFRSVCSSWRTAAEPKSLVPSQYFTILPDNGGSLFPDVALGFRLSQRIILLIEPPYEQEDSIGWQVKVGEHSRKVALFHPLTDDNNHMFRNFTGVLDMSKFKVRELGREFKLHYVYTDDGRCKHSRCPYCQKTVVKYLDSDADSKFVLLTIHDSGKLAVFTSWGQAWTVINDMPGCCFRDVILFHGCFFAVEENGRTVVVDLSSLKLTLAANPVFGGDKKFLVESGGEMLLVDMYLNLEFDSGSLWNFEEEDIEENDSFLDNEITHKLKVFKFVERDKSWVEVKDLGDQMLFLGDHSTFSASASDISPLYESTVFFHGVVFDRDDLRTMEDKDLGMCDFETGEIKLVRQNPEYAELFWPPPPWIQ